MGLRATRWRGETAKRKLLFFLGGAFGSSATAEGTVALSATGAMGTGVGLVPGLGRHTAKAVKSTNMARSAKCHSPSLKKFQEANIEKGHWPLNQFRRRLRKTEASVPGARQDMGRLSGPAAQKRVIGLGEGFLIACGTTGASGMASALN